tara:strand:+ start:9114 stop:9422 length:309 start_codon:yes stop_codon:yes gene_type:complete
MHRDYRRQVRYNCAAFRLGDGIEVFRSACIHLIRHRAMKGAETHCGKNGLMLTKKNSVREQDAVAFFRSARICLFEQHRPGRCLCCLENDDGHCDVLIRMED